MIKTVDFGQLLLKILPAQTKVPRKTCFYLNFEYFNEIHGYPCINRWFMYFIKLVEIGRVNWYLNAIPLGVDIWLYIVIFIEELYIFEEHLKSITILFEKY